MRTAAAEAKYTEETLYVALELGWSTWKLAFTVGLGQKARLRSMPAGDVKRLEEEIGRAKERFGLRRRARVVSCYEAGRDGFWLHRYLEACGVKSLVVDAASIEVQRRRRRAKTDGLDAGKLVAMLVRGEEGEKRVWSVLRVPSVEEEDARQLHRELGTLKRERTRQINRIKGLLAGQGLRVERIGADFPRWLERARLWDGSSLPAGLRFRLEGEHERLAFVQGQIQEVEAERRRRWKESKEKGVEKARRLAQLKGIGINASWLYGLEFFGWREFRNRKQVGSLAGLTPTPYQSGGSAREQGISKAGNKRVRAMAIEIAWGWLRFQPRSQLSRWYEERFGGGTSRQRRIGIVALARKLLIALWRWVDQGVLPEGAELRA